MLYKVKAHRCRELKVQHFQVATCHLYIYCSKCFSDELPLLQELIVYLQSKQQLYFYKHKKKEDIYNIHTYRKQCNDKVTRDAPCLTRDITEYVVPQAQVYPGKYGSTTPGGVQIHSLVIE